MKRRDYAKENAKRGTYTHLPQHYLHGNWCAVGSIQEPRTDAEEAQYDQWIEERKAEIKARPPKGCERTDHLAGGIREIEHPTTTLRRMGRL